MAKSNFRILIVNRDPDFLEIISDVLVSEIGVRPDVALTWSEASILLMTSKYDVLVTDMQGRELSGLDLIVVARGLHRSAYIICVCPDLWSYGLQQADLYLMGADRVWETVDFTESLIDDLRLRMKLKL